MPLSSSAAYAGGMIVTITREITTRGQGDAHDLTGLVAASVADSKCDAGIATVFVVGSTAAVTTIEFEPGAIADLNRLLEEVAPRNADYRHHLRWGDDNGSSHVRAALLGPSLTVPFRRTGSSRSARGSRSCCSNWIRGPANEKSLCRLWRVTAAMIAWRAGDCAITDR